MARNATTLINYNQSRDNINLCNMYGKKRKATKAAVDLPEGRPMKYVPYEDASMASSSSAAQSKVDPPALKHPTREASSDKPKKSNDN